MNLAFNQSVSLYNAFDALQFVTTPPFPQGTNVSANASLSFVDTLFSGNSPDPTFAATAFIWSWTFYQEDGTQSGPQSPPDFFQNSVEVDSCATITFAVFVERAWAFALLNVFSL
jgi:hypothetical protein